MGRGSVSNIDIGSRLRQFVFLIVMTAFGMVISVAFFGAKGGHGTKHKSDVRPPSKSANTVTAGF